ncbi:YqzL family protein [Siminovitchia sediminis]|uniref:YqzL family protein n=1 Tax=Siminovitchia sediminis TaxID=1274353 RepID=A0ABW4KCB2_9BACI
MYELTWKLFKKTGNIDIYLLLKELEKEERMMNTLPNSDNPDVIDHPVS